MNTSEQYEMTTGGRVLRWALPVGAALLVLLMSGCQSASAPKVDDMARDDDDARPLQDAMTAQSSAGARADAMLFACHFDGSSLNSLGQAKLRLMLLDPELANVLTVYVNTSGQDTLLQQRQASVTKFLRDGGWTDKQVAVAAGANPNGMHPAADSLTRMGKTESGAAETAPADSGSGQAPSAAPSGGGYSSPSGASLKQ